jgi:hypothetical protein
MTLEELQNIVATVEGSKSEEYLMELRSVTGLRLRNLSRERRGMNLIDEKEKELAALKQQYMDGVDITADQYDAAQTRKYLDDSVITVEQVRGIIDKNKKDED